MDQMSLFSIGVAEPTIADLGGLLAGPGQITLGAGAARLSVLVPERWRADALAREFAIRDVGVRVREADPHEFGSLIDGAGAAPDPTADDPTADDPTADDPTGGNSTGGNSTSGDPTGGDSTGEHRPIGPLYLVRSERSAALVPLAAAWTRGAVKQAAALPAAPGGFLRCWALASGRLDAAGYLLGLDPRAEQLHTRLASALAAVGMTGVLLGGRAGGPAVRIVGRRRLARLAELLGDAPPGAPEDAFPSGR